MNHYRSVLAHVSNSGRAAEVLHCAALLAVQHGAALHAIHAGEPLHIGAHLVVESAMIAAQLREDEQRRRAAAAQARVDQAARSFEVPIDFRSFGGDPVDALIARSRGADLVVMGQPSDDDADEASRRMVSHVVVGAGCAVLFLPAAARVDNVGRRVVVAWSSNRHSSRAVRDALPMLQRAAAVEVLHLGPTVAESTNALDTVVAYLVAHGVPAVGATRRIRRIAFDERVLVPSSVDSAVARSLLDRATDLDADLLVMGGYGHTRSYELVLGGVTRAVLESMTVPVLMSH